MDAQVRALIYTLASKRSLRLHEYESLILGLDLDAARLLADLARLECERVYGDAIFVRGLIEISNRCGNDCLYCGLRLSNSECERYRLSAEQILECVDTGFDAGFRTFVLQSGEDPALTDKVLGSLLRKIKRRYPRCAITLSLGERSTESYQTLFDSGADRYLLRHETADPTHYKRLHPRQMSYDNRMRCLRSLKAIGYAVGCGFMVGSPFQGPLQLARDLRFIERFSPQMCGIGPFIPHHATPFASKPAGSVALTCAMLSIIRLIKPNILLPATTALGSLDKTGREKGILAGANVVMPNLSPMSVRKKYEIYDNKLASGEEAAENLSSLSSLMEGIGRRVVVSRGDPAPDPGAKSRRRRDPSNEGGRDGIRP